MASEDTSKPKLRFRNYQPADASLKEIATVAPIAVAPSVAQAEKDAEETARLVRQSAERDAAPLPVVPRKVDWDLARDEEPRLAKLERMTQKAIADLIRQRIAAQAAASAPSASSGAAASAATAPARDGSAGGAGGASAAAHGSSGSAGTPADLDARYEGPLDAAALARAVGEAGQDGEQEAGAAQGERRARRRYADDED